MLHSVHAVLFDLDNTLIERRKALAHVAHALIREFLPNRLSEYCALKECFCDCFKDGYLKNRDCYELFCRKIQWNNALPYDQFFTYWSFFYPYNSTPVPDMLDTLQCLKAKGYLLGIITNGPITMQNAKIEKIGIRDLFDTIVVSQKLGIEKPSPEIFAYTAQLLHLPVQECLYVGDHPRNDIFGAASAGMQTAWYNAFVPWDDQYAPADVEINGLADLKKLL